MKKTYNTKYIKIISYSILLCFIFTFSSYALLLERGDRGAEVEKVQQYLYQLGYDVSVDGHYGPRTEDIVKNFQYNNDLTVDGIVGQNTFDVLEDNAEDQKYIVQAGDTISELALENNSTVEAIIDRNNLNNESIYAGQTLYIPEVGRGGASEDVVKSNIMHEVEQGEVLGHLARRYGTDIETIKLANNLNSDRIYAGQTLVIPHAGTRIGEFRLQRGSLIWPVLGRISSRFGWRNHPVSGQRDFHNGVDIAVPTGTEIRTVASGEVIRSGWKGGYGYTVVIDHGRDIKTLYAHNSRLLVRNGEIVNTGDKIALAGSTGVSTGSHLHFGLRVNGEYIDPLNYLPR